MKGFLLEKIFKPFRQLKRAEKAANVGRFSYGNGAQVHMDHGDILKMLLVLCLLSVMILSYLHFNISDRKIAYAATLVTFLANMIVTFALTRKDLVEQYSRIVHKLNEKHKTKIHKLRREHDMATLEKTIRDGTRTLIKNAVDYFKIENIKNEFPVSAALQNLQLDKYGQIIELLADFSLILPDYHENQEIVKQEINHQIEIYEIDEKAFAQFLQRIMEKYVITVSKKIREKEDQTAKHVGTRVCPNCSERILIKAKRCRYCGHRFGKEETTDGNQAENSAVGDDMKWVKQAQALYRAGNFQKVLDLLNEAIKENPKSSQAYYSRGLLHEKLGNQNLALKDLTAAAQLGHKKAQKFLLSYMDSQEYPFEPPASS